MKAAAVTAVLLGLAAGTAHADLVASGSSGTAVDIVPPQAAGLAGKILFINRCKGGCMITKGGSPGDARAHISGIPDGDVGQVFTLTEFMWGDADWEAMMQCLREVYSPYGVTLTEAPPPSGTAYNEGIVAGIDNEINRGGLLGVAPVSSDCSPLSYTISFTFANSFGPGSANSICSVVAQETGHSFGLAHSFEFADGRSACTDPMSYRGDCGGQRFFRNEPAVCGEFEAAACGSCGTIQNTHSKLIGVLGAGTPITAPPEVSVTMPVADEVIQNEATVNAIASAQRGIKRVELYLNGYKWAEAPGAAWGGGGQPASAYIMRLPANVPDGIIDILVRAKDDIDVATDAAVITVRKGEPCASADTCAEGQRCDAGRCLWDAPVGELGDQCEFPQFCKNELCAEIAAGESRCSQGCVLGTSDACPVGFECLESTATTGVCWPEGVDKGGCCSTSTSTAAAQSGLLGLAIVVVVRRRRRRVD